MRGVKRAKAEPSQGLPARRASINCSGVCVSNGDPGYVAHFLSLHTESVSREREREREREDACSYKEFLARESRVRYVKPVEVKKSSHESDEVAFESSSVYRAFFLEIFSKVARNFFENEHR